MRLDEANQRRLKQVRDFLHDYTRLRWTVNSAFALVAFVVWWTMGGEIDRLRHRVASERYRAALIGELKSQKRFSDAMTPFLPGAEGHDLPWWLDQFTTAAQRAGVQLDKSIPKPGTARLGPYPVCNFTVEAIGSYQGLVRFVDIVENIKPTVKIDRCDVEELVGEAARLLSVDMLPGERRAALTMTVLMSPNTR